ncbi:Dolichyl-diphosphooligosaccharide--protein glycosyltransferase subunit STT3B [Dirofilaria immitis]|nr:Dolichyl-diphosphooligosaccharide--protein glycosyltransferase subunit STT3B [Dirofilaria immitis]
MLPFSEYKSAVAYDPTVVIQICRRLVRRKQTPMRFAFFVTHASKLVIAVRTFQRIVKLIGFTRRLRTGNMTDSVLSSIESNKMLVSNSLGITSLLTFVILVLAWLVGFASRLFAVIRFESIIHEFDPWFNYRSTHYMVEHGFYNFLNWFDERAWYPLGRIVGGTVYPGLMVTSGAIHYILSILNISVHIRDVCVFLAPIFSGLTAIATYFLTKELWTPGAGLFAACFIAISPGYTSRSVAGSYDNEGIAIFALQFTYFLWVRSVKTGSIFWATLTALSYFYMVSAWEKPCSFCSNFAIVVLTAEAYTTFYILGQIMAMQIPFVGFQPVKTSEHMAAAGVFGLLQVIAALKYMQHRVSRKEFMTLFFCGVSVVLVLGISTIVLLTYAGYIAPWSGRFYSLWDTGYAKIHIPIIASVSEHQPTTWVSFFFDLHITAAVFPVGLWYCVKNVNDERVFGNDTLCSNSCLFCWCNGSFNAYAYSSCLHTFRNSFSYTYERYLIDEGDQSKSINSEEENKHLYDKVGKGRKGGSWTNQAAPESSEVSIGMNARSIVSVVLVLMLLMFVVHCTYVTSNAYSHPSVVLQSHNSHGGREIMDDFREAYYWLRKNTEENARVMSWWDYGYQIAGMANRTTLVDNNTWNNSHIALVGKAMASNESAAYEVMRALDVDYVLVILVALSVIQAMILINFCGCVGAEASETMLNSVMYKISYYRFGDIELGYRQQAGFDRTRGYIIGRKNIVLEHLEEAYTSQNWLDKSKKGIVQGKPTVVKGHRPPKRA